VLDLEPTPALSGVQCAREGGGGALSIQHNNGVVRFANGPGQFMLWEIER